MARKTKFVNGNGNLDFRSVLYGFFIEDENKGDLEGGLSDEFAPSDDTTLRDSADDELMVYLTIVGSEFEDVEAKVTKPDRTIIDQVNRIIDVFELPRYYGDGSTPRTYLLGVLKNECEEPIILEFENEEGEPQTLLDYGIKSGDHLYLVEPPLYGSAF